MTFHLRRSLVLGAVVGCVSLVACGLDVVGEGPVAMDALRDAASPAPVPDVTPEDAAQPNTIDAQADADDPGPSACAQTGTSCTDALPSGWHPVAVLHDTSAACPAGFSAQDLVQGTVGSDPCACEAKPSIEDPPSCDSDDKFNAKFGNVAPLCLVDRAPYKVESGACIPFDFPALGSKNGDFVPIKHAGACVAACTPKAGDIAQTPWRICEPAPECTEEACQGASTPNTGSALRFCVAHEGDVPCPDDDPADGGDSGSAADAGLMLRNLIGTQPTLTCEDGTCENAFSCTDPKVHVFGSKDCAAPELASVVANDKCLPLPDNAQAFAYTATMVPEPSKITKVGTATLHYAGATKTVCCR